MILIFFNQKSCTSQTPYPLQTEILVIDGKSNWYNTQTSPKEDANTGKGPNIQSKSGKETHITLFPTIAIKNPLSNTNLVYSLNDSVPVVNS